MGEEPSGNPEQRNNMGILLQKINLAVVYKTYYSKERSKKDYWVITIVQPRDDESLDWSKSIEGGEGRREGKKGSGGRREGWSDTNWEDCKAWWPTAYGWQWSGPSWISAIHPFIWLTKCMYKCQALGIWRWIRPWLHGAHSPERKATPECTSELYMVLWDWERMSQNLS